MKISEGFNSELTERLDRLRLRFKRQVGGVGGGTRRSNEKGSSNEFSDFRSYTDGDSLRFVDWNSYARLDKLFVKLYMEEKQTEITIIADCSASMDFYNKAYVAGLVSVSLCYAAVGGGDRARLVMGDKQLLFSSKAELAKLLSFADSIQNGGSFDIENSVRNISFNNKGRTILISDFMYPLDELERAVKYLAYKKQELTLVMLTADEENEPSLAGEIVLNDAETNEKVYVEIDDATLKAYNNALKAHKVEISNICRKYGAEFNEIRAEENFASVICKVLK